MDPSYTVIRRFTPPTCTLEIGQKNPARYFGFAKQTTEDYQFKLSFDDPRLFEGEAISLTGDQGKLDRLCLVVSTYIEEFLAQSFVDSSSPASEIFSFKLSADSLAGGDLPEEELATVIDPSLEDSDSLDLAGAEKSFNSSFSLPGLVNHRLDLDALELGADVPDISLSATQLFDLGSALDDYQEAMLALAQEQKQQVQKKKEIFPFRFTALVGFVAIALGLLGSGILFRSRWQNQVASRQENVNLPDDLKVGADVIPPKVSENAKKPVAKVQETPSLSDRERLPPPPAVTTPKPPPNIPDPAKFSPPVGSLDIPPWKPLPSQKSAASSSSSQTNSGQVDSNKTAANKTAANQTAIDNTQVEATISIPPQTAKQKNSGLSAPANKVPQTTVVEPDAQINNSKDELARLAQTEKSSAQESLAAGEQKTTTATIKDLPGQSGANRSAQLRLEDRASRQDSDNSTANLGEQLALQDKKGTDGDAKSTSLSSDDNFSGKSRNTGDLVQLQEISSYFRNKWRSPQELRQTLEYRLILSQDGSIQRIIPIGKAAGIYLDRTNIPLRGEPFVSPFTEQDAITVRLLLSPDGEVRTFLE